MNKSMSERIWIFIVFKFTEKRVWDIIEELLKNDHERWFSFINKVNDFLCKEDEGLERVKTENNSDGDVL